MRRLRHLPRGTSDLCSMLKIAHPRGKSGRMANQMGGTKSAGRRFMTEISGIEDFGTYDLVVLYIIKLELLRVAEMLKNLTVFISHSDFHDNITSCLYI